MGKNSYLERQRIEKQAHFDAGLQMGRQQILDLMCIVLNDPDIMGKDTFGKDRLLKVVKGIGEYIDVFQKRGSVTTKQTISVQSLMKVLREHFGDRCRTLLISGMNIVATLIM